MRISNVQRQANFMPVFNNPYVYVRVTSVGGGGGGGVTHYK